MDAQIHLPFTTSHAFLIGINEYEHISSLGTAVKDVTDIAELLKDENKHGYEVHVLTDASKKEMEAFFEKMKEKVKAKDRVMFYYAGHGIAIDSEGDPKGYLVPADAEPDNTDSLVPMKLLHETLSNLPCKHGLLVLDCCFAGAFKWSTGYRAINWGSTEVLYAERFWRFVEFPAWQVITSSAKDQKAADILNKQALGLREEEDSKDKNSPFAWAFKQAIDTNSKADSAGYGGSDGVVTATELYNYIREVVETATLSEYKRQSPAIFTLGRHNTKGEYIFLNPGHRLNLPQAPDINPYKGLSPYEGTKTDARNFFGRTTAIKSLTQKISQSPILVISAPSGQGKSSIIKAGLFPAILKENETPPISLRPGERLTQAWENLDLLDPAEKQVVLIDQYEEMFSLEEGEQVFFEKKLADFLTKISSSKSPALSCILAIRSDFEWQLKTSLVGKSFWNEDKLQQFLYRLPPMSQEELKEIMVKPAWTVAYEFESEALINQILEEINHSPGALPLLSFTLQKLYENRDTNKRLFTRKAYKKDLGGVNGALNKYADALYEKMPGEAHKDFMRKLIIRMVRLNDGGYSQRRVYLQVPSKIAKRGYIDELDYPDHLDAIKDEVLEILEKSLLVIRDQDTFGLYVEPMHDSLLNFWPRCLQWIQDFGRENLVLQRQIWQAVVEHHQWERGIYNIASQREEQAPLWDNNPKLQQVQIAVTDPQDQWLCNKSFGNHNIGSFAYLLWELQPNKEQIHKLSPWQMFFDGAEGEDLFKKIHSQMDHWLNEEELAFVKRSFEVQRSEIEQLKRERDDARATALAAKSRQVYAVDNTLALNLAYAAYIITGNEDSKPALIDVLENPESKYYAQIFEGNGGAFSPDGKQAIILSKGILRFYNIESGEKSNQFEEVRNHGISFSILGKHLFIEYLDGSVKLLSIEPEKVIKQFTGVRGNGVSFSPDGKQLRITYQDGFTKLYSVTSGEENRQFEHASLHISVDQDVLFSPDSKLLLIRSEQGSQPLLKLFSIESDVEQEFQGGTSGEFSGNSKHLLIRYPNRIKLWSIENSKDIKQFQPGYQGSFSPDSKHLIINANGNFKLCSPDSGIEQQKIKEDSLRGVLFSPDSSQRLSYSKDSVKLLTLETGKEAKINVGHIKGNHTWSFSPDSKYLLLQSEENLRLWSVGALRDVSSYGYGQGRDNEPQQFQGGHSGSISPDSKHILVKSMNGIRLFAISPTTELPNPSIYLSSSTNVTSSPNGKRVLISDDFNSFLSSVESGKILRKVLHYKPLSEKESRAQGGKRYDESLIEHQFTSTFSPDGNYLFMLNEGILVLYSSESGEEIKRFEDRVKRSTTYFSKDNKFLFHSHRKIWSIERREDIQISTLNDNDPTQSHSFSSDGKLLGIQSSDGLRFYSVESGQELQRFDEEHTRGTLLWAISPDLKLLFLKSEGAAGLWSMESGKQIKRFDDDNIATGFNPVSFSPDSKILALSSQLYLQTYSTESGDELQRFKKNHGGVHFIFSPDYTHLIFENSILSAASGEELRQSENFNFSNTSGAASFFPDGKQILIKKNNEAWIFSIELGNNIQHFKNVAGCSILGDDQSLMVLYQDRTIDKWINPLQILGKSIYKLNEEEREKYKIRIEY